MALTAPIRNSAGNRFKLRLSAGCKRVAHEPAKTSRRHRMANRDRRVSTPVYARPNRCLLHRSPFKRQHCAGRRRHRASAASSHIGYTATNTAWRSSEARAIWQQTRGDIARFSTADALVWRLRTAAKTNDNAQGTQNRPHRNAVATAPAHFDASQTSTAFEFALARLVPWHGICGFIGEGSVSSIGYSSLWMKRTPL